MSTTYNHTTWRLFSHSPDLDATLSFFLMSSSLHFCPKSLFLFPCFSSCFCPHVLSPPFVSVLPLLYSLVFVPIFVPVFICLSVFLFICLNICLSVPVLVSRPFLLPATVSLCLLCILISVSVAIFFKLVLISRQFLLFLSVCQSFFA